MKLIVGLGNPGKKYEGNRHNVGFMALDLLKKKLDFDDFTFNKKHNAELSKGVYQATEVLLAKPATFMNLSGKAVQSLLSYYDISLRDLLVIYDDVDLPLAELRYREKGSSGTHNGMRSIIAELGSEDFSRLRIGIESRGVSMPKQMETSDFVLADFSDLEKEKIDLALQEAASLVLERFL